MFPTLKDIAERAGVHSSTVSRVLGGKENLLITEETRQRILAVAKELNYQPNHLARAFRLKKTQTIGLIIPDISNPFFSGIAHSIEKASSSAEYNLVVCNTDEKQDKEIHLVHTLLSRGIDGLILAPVQNRYQHIQDLCNKNFPLVLIDRCFENIDTNVVISDNEHAAYQAVVHLAKLGHHRIGFVSGRKNIYTIQQRYSGYKKAVTDYHLEGDTSLTSENGFTSKSGFESTLKLLSIESPPTALLISGNLITVGAMQAIMEKGLLVPDEISIIGFTDFICSPFWIAPLTTITHPLEEMGKKAFATLLERMQAEKPLPNAKVVVKTKLTIRKSVKALMIENDHL
jgi:DNA-binding LacI/PurR family transcriptional regulator